MVWQETLQFMKTSQPDTLQDSWKIMSTRA